MQSVCRTVFVYTSLVVERYNTLPYFLNSFMYWDIASWQWHYGVRPVILRDCGTGLRFMGYYTTLSGAHGSVVG
jgi:hypothetical protein